MFRMVFDFASSILCLLTYRLNGRLNLKMIRCEACDIVQFGHSSSFWHVIFIFRTDLTYLPFSREKLLVSPSLGNMLVAIMGGRRDLGQVWVSSSGLRSACSVT